MNVIGKKHIFISVSGILVVAAVIAISVFGFKPGIDFVGGSLWQLKFSDSSVTREKLGDFLFSSLKLEHITITADTTGGSFIVRATEIKEEDHAGYLEKLKEGLGGVDELQFQTIGAAVGKELRAKAITAFILVLVGISIYIAFAFRKVSKPVSSWKYGIITLVTLFHDALIPAGLMAFLGYALNLEIDTNFIVAILVVMGFSVHDTIVVFDRIRENLRLSNPAKKDFSELVNESVNQTMARSINTSLTLVLVLIAMYIFGSSTLTYFILTILVGTIVGTYSSIFVASPLLTMWRGRS